MSSADYSMSRRKKAVAIAKYNGPKDTTVNWRMGPIYIPYNPSNDYPPTDAQKNMFVFAFYSTEIRARVVWCRETFGYDVEPTILTEVVPSTLELLSVVTFILQNPADATMFRLKWGT